MKKTKFKCNEEMRIIKKKKKRKKTKEKKMRMKYIYKYIYINDIVYPSIDA